MITDMDMYIESYDSAYDIYCHIDDVGTCSSPIIKNLNFDDNKTIDETRTFLLVENQKRSTTLASRRINHQSENKSVLMNRKINIEERIRNSTSLYCLEPNENDKDKIKKLESSSTELINKVKQNNECISKDVPSIVRYVRVIPKKTIIPHEKFDGNNKIIHDEKKHVLLKKITKDLSLLHNEYQEMIIEAIISKSDGAKMYVTENEIRNYLLLHFDINCWTTIRNNLNFLTYRRVLQRYSNSYKLNCI